MRVVLDTNVLVRANPKASGLARIVLTELARAPGHELVLSPFILDEVERVLSYPRAQAVWPLSPTEIQDYTAALAVLAEIVHVGPAPSVVLSDPHDDPVIATALVGRANILCTLDRHFYAPDVLEFLRKHTVEVMNDVNLLARLRTSSAGP